MNIEDFRSWVAAYLEKKTSDFSAGDLNWITIAANNAKLWAQREHDFEYLRTDAQVVVNQTSGGLLTSATLLGTNDAIAIMRVRRAYVPYADGSHRPIDIISGDKAANRLHRAYSNPTYDPTKSRPAIFDDLSAPALVLRGTRVYLYPANTVFFEGSNLTVGLDVYQRLPDYSGDDAEDMFLQFSPEFLFWRSLIELNAVVQKFVPRQEGNVGGQFLADKMQEAWDSLIKWDENFAGDEPIELD